MPSSPVSHFLLEKGKYSFWIWLLWLALPFFFPFSSFVFVCFLGYMGYGFWVSVLPFLFFPFYSSIYRFISLVSYGVLGFLFFPFQVHAFPFKFSFRVMGFLFFPFDFHTGICVSCSSLYIFIQGYVFPVLPFTFSYRVMNFLFFPLDFHIGICVSCSSLYIFI